MLSLDDIALVSEEDFASTYNDVRRASLAMERLNQHGITFPITYASPFFPQLNRLAVLVYFRGSLVVRGVPPELNYAVHLFTNGRVSSDFVEGMIRPYFSAASNPSDNRVSVCDGNTGNARINLNRPLARILHCLGIPTDSGHLVSGALPHFLTSLAASLPELGTCYEAERARSLLFDACKVFLTAKATLVHNFHWEFFLPVKQDEPTAEAFRTDLTCFLEAALPDIQFKKVGGPREREGRPHGRPITYYDSIVALNAKNVRLLISNFAHKVGLESLLGRRPPLTAFYNTVNSTSA